MGFYLRKSVSVGPFRFNLSSSGLGVSTGIKGFRVGTGPRGNYVHMGYGGIYFRQTLPSSRNRQMPPVPAEENSSDVDFKEIESGSVEAMVDSSSEALLLEINSKAKKPLIWPWAVGATICLVVALVALGSPGWVYFLTAPFCVVGVGWAVYADKLRKTVVLLYHLEPHIEQAYQNLHGAFDLLRSCSRMWHVESKGDIRTTYDWKVHSGANALVKRNGTNPRSGSPSYFKTNISIPVLPAGRRHLFFLPDRILVWDSQGVGAVGFDQLDVGFGDQRFIEDEGVPNDSRIVDKTWRYVNKKGGPDRRFNNNREIPIVLYEALFLTSKSGLQELFQLSRTGVGVQLKNAVATMASAISSSSDPNEEYIKCPCNHCDVLIEFPARGVGQRIVCPHCGLETVLFVPEQSSGAQS